ncbi:MAG: isoprenyl transferase [Ignavibacteriae bacterium]|nr:isoprenyl transferase [Ignavibacteriota bacterium]
MNWLNEGEPEDRLLQQELLSGGELPKHIAIIMDGNGRWAKQRRMPRIEGHRSGVGSVKDIVKACGQLGVSYLTLYAFSTENWKRPKTEVTLLMDLLLYYLKTELKELNENNVRLNAIGQLNALPKNVARQLHESIDYLSDNTGLTLTLALSYSGRWDILRAVQTLALDVRRGTLSPEDITEEKFRSYLNTHDIPDPDLMIRTSGEMRLSNFLLWEMAYAEIYIAPVFWPEFRREQLYEGLWNYLGRERRFGKISEQLLDEQDANDKKSYVRKVIDIISRNKQ